MGTNTFLVLINQRSGGQDGPQLLDKFRTLAQEGLEGQQHLEVDKKTHSQCSIDLMMLPAISGCLHDRPPSFGTRCRWSPWRAREIQRHSKLERDR